MLSRQAGKLFLVGVCVTTCCCRRRWRRCLGLCNFRSSCFEGGISLHARDRVLAIPDISMKNTFAPLNFPLVHNTDENVEREKQQIFKLKVINGKSWKEKSYNEI